MKKNIIKYLYSEWGDFTEGNKLAVGIIALSLSSLICLVSEDGPIPLFSITKSVIKNEAFYTALIFGSVFLFQIVYSLFYLFININRKIIKKYPIFTYILDFFCGFSFCMIYLSLFVVVFNVMSYKYVPILFLLFFILSIIIILVCYYKFYNFFIGMANSNFNVSDKHGAQNMNDKYYKNSWNFIFSAIIVLTIIGPIIRDKFFMPRIFCSVLFLGGTYYMLASISCMICSYKERKKCN